MSLEDAGWCFVSELLLVGRVLSQGQDPRTAPALNMLREDCPGDAEALTAFWFDASAPLP